MADRDCQYDVSVVERRILEERAKRKACLRNEFIKQISNPHQHATGDSGAVFDSALQRFVALKATSYDQFRPNPKTTAIGILLVAVPMLSYAWLLKSVRDKQEQKYRTGQVAYRDRRFKFQ